MKNYEIKIENRKNTISSNFIEPMRWVLTAKNKQQAIDFAYELFQQEFFMSRAKVKITATILED